MIDYSKMSDDEINDLVIDRLVTSGDFTYDHDDCSGKLYVSGGWCWGAGIKTNLFKDGKPFITHHNGRKLDFCNNPADAWPIIVENKISIEHVIIKWRASSLVYDKKYESGFFIFRSESDVGDISSRGALRAAMIVFLMMQEKTNGD